MAQSPSPHKIYRPTPRLSANELARYMVTPETGKIGIIHRAKEATTSQVIRYSKVRQSLRGFLCDSARSSQKLSAIWNMFEQRSNDAALSPYLREDALLSLDVIDAFTKMQNQIAGAKFEPAPAKQAPLLFHGVEVNVQVDVLMTRSKGTKEEIGGVLFRMSKADEETEAAAAKRRDMGAYVATLALMHVQQHLAGSRIPHHQLSASFDIQCGEVHSAPKGYATRAQNLENACRFIAAMWDTA